MELPPENSFPPITEADPDLTPAKTGPLPPRIARWRWLVALFLIGAYPLFVAVLGFLRGRHVSTSSNTTLPSTLQGLLMFSLYELGIFAAFWLLGWAFSRATRDELMLHWRGGFWPVAQGFGYAIGLRFAVGLLVIFVATVFAIVTRVDPETISKFIQQNQPRTEGLLSKSALNDPLYLAVMLTFVSFVVAGLREELWRVAAMASLRNIAPDSWSQTARWIGAITISSIVFGFGHLYQGWTGVILTGFLGIGLGAITWRHRSFWPAVLAHGFFDSTSFLLLALVASKKIPLP